MPLSLLFLTIAVLLVIGLVLQAVWLWVCLRWCLEEPPSLRAAIGLFVGLQAINWMVSLGLAVVLPGSGPIAMLVASLAIWLGLIAAIIQIFQTQWWRAAVASLVYAVVGGIAAVAAISVYQMVLAEAYVVPTGSMAMTVIGRHLDVTCPHCGSSFTFGFPRVWEQQLIWSGGEPVACPRCGGEVSWQNLPAADGDRVLCDKNLRPQRWHIMVFEPPPQPEQSPGTRYIDRLVGLPGERVEVFGGDVFIDGRREAKPVLGHEEMWIPLHDTAESVHPPAKPRWESEFGPELPLHGPWQFDRSESRTARTVRYTGPIANDLDYNRLGRPGDSLLPVPDVRVICHVTAAGKEARLALLWTFEGRKVAMIAGPRRSDVAELPEFEREDRGWVRLWDDKPLAADEQIVFQIRDGQAACLRNGQVAFSESVLPPELSRARFRLAGEAPTVGVSLAVMDDECMLARVELSRDVYYLNQEEMRFGKKEASLLAPDEFFLLGDNSAMSSDSRFFGPVPRKSLFGGLRLRYWPPSRWYAFD